MPTQNGSLSGQGLRSLGSVEHFFFACHQIVGSMNLVAIYELSTPITLHQLKQCAEKLRSRYQALQVTVQHSWKNGTAGYVQADNLKLNLAQEDHVTDPIQLMLKLLTKEEEIKKQIVQDGQSLLEHSSVNYEFLPWSLHLSHSGDYVALSSPHHIMDGVSLEIIGAEIVRILNGKEMIAKTLSKIPELPVEQQMGNVSWKNRLKTYLSLFAQIFSKMDMMGINTDNIPRDWTQYKSILKCEKVKMSQIEKFHQRCKESKVTLNSGMVSAFYEAVAKTPPFNTAGKTPLVTIPIDIRRRVEDSSGLLRHSVGVYAPFGTFTETGDSEEWKNRAQSLQSKIHSDRALNGFAETSLSMRIASKYAEHILPVIGNDAYYGRHVNIMFSNLGRTSFINNANSICSENDVRIESLFFDESGCASGSLLSVHSATVGESFCWCIAAYEPFVSQRELHAVNQEFSKILTN